MNLYAFMHFMHLNCHASASYVHFFNCGLGISGLIKRCICCCCRWWWCWWWWWWCWWWWCWWWKRTRAHTGSAETREHALLWPGHVKFRQRCICWGVDRRCRLGALEHVCLLVSPGEVRGGRGTVGGGQGGVRCLDRVISESPSPEPGLQSALFRSGYQRLSWGTAEMGRSIRRRQIHAVEEFVEIQSSFAGKYRILVSFWLAWVLENWWSKTKRVTLDSWPKSLWDCNT